LIVLPPAINSGSKALVDPQMSALALHGKLSVVLPLVGKSFRLFIAGGGKTDYRPL